MSTITPTDVPQTTRRRGAAAHSCALPVPVIDTERLILRAIRPSDHAAYAAYFQTTRADFTGGRKTEAETFAAMASMAGHWHLRGYGLWTLQDRASGATAGWTGILNNFDWPEPELGWTVFEGFEGRGLAFEAALAARAHAAQHFGIVAPISLIHPDNVRSAALARRLDARFERETTLRATPCHIWRHPTVAGIPEGTA